MTFQPVEQEFPFPISFPHMKEPTIVRPQRSKLLASAKESLRVAINFWREADKVGKGREAEELMEASFSAKNLAMNTIETLIQSCEDAKQGYLSHGGVRRALEAASDDLGRILVELEESGLAGDFVKCQWALNRLNEVSFIPQRKE